MRMALFLSAAISLIALPSSSLAATSPTAPAPPPSLNDNFSAADQYVESVPTSRGPKVPGVGKHADRGGRPSKATLAPAVVTQLQSEPADTARKLERIATEPTLGAPVENLRPASARSSPHVPTATVRAVGEGEQDNMKLLLIALFLITALAAGTAGHRYNERRKAARRG
jgi:hypothetical protein